MNTDDVLKIEYDHIDYDDLLKYYSRIFKTKYHNNILEMPGDFGEGHMKLLEIPNGLQCLLGNYKVNHNLVFQRTRNETPFFVLRFDELKDDEENPQAQPRSAACLTSSDVSGHFIMETKGSKIKSLKVKIGEDWLNNFVKDEPAGEKLKHHLLHKSSVFSYEPLDKEYKELLNQILYPDCDERFQLLYLQNRVMLLIERFFTHFLRRAELNMVNIKLPNSDIQRLKEAERELTRDLTNNPSISVLARKIGMSESKLKVCFKEMYGLSIYQYFQRYRMQMAKARLISKKYTIRQISEELGYDNTSSFSKAFYKVFEQYPSDVTGEP
ncbi:AraC-type DNA-binding protein [Filimonas lacunae]|uniref:AraC-type DNA-binding protein n=1 Tax=Filimonas lacunae TaxID=477680 RepID=A0A173MLG7_9BACT|nr:AraC family transcriptional regulator [Filimonas lacunae]BAV08251.1 transcriptional regulator, AraC family [Filimonas lacunae]SIT33169.1 AraC-type DNA-binding protein [Filimonas lacunae]